MAQRGKRRAREATLEQERMTAGVVGEQADRRVAVPPREGLGLVFGLPVRELDLEHRVTAVRKGGGNGE